MVAIFTYSIVFTEDGSVPPAEIPRIGEANPVLVDLALDRSPKSFESLCVAIVINSIWLVLPGDSPPAIIPLVWLANPAPACLSFPINSPKATASPFD